MVFFHWDKCHRNIYKNIPNLSPSCASYPPSQFLLQSLFACLLHPLRFQDIFGWPSLLGMHDHSKHLPWSSPPCLFWIMLLRKQLCLLPLQPLRNFTSETLLIGADMFKQNGASYNCFQASAPSCLPIWPVYGSQECVKYPRWIFYPHIVFLSKNLSAELLCQLLPGYLPGVYTTSCSLKRESKHEHLQMKFTPTDSSMNSVEQLILKHQGMEYFQQISMNLKVNGGKKSQKQCSNSCH